MFLGTFTALTPQGVMSLPMLVSIASGSKTRVDAL